MIIFVFLTSSLVDSYAKLKLEKSFLLYRKENLRDDGGREKEGIIMNSGLGDLTKREKCVTRTPGVLQAWIFC